MRAEMKNSFSKIRSLTLAAIILATTVPANSEEGDWQIVNYWSEWCAPCRVEIPMFNALAQELESSNVSIVGINFDEDPRDVTLDIAEEMGIKFPTLTLEESAALELRAPDVMPTTYILNPDGEVVAKLIGMQERDDILARLEELGLTISKDFTEREAQ